MGRVCVAVVLMLVLGPVLAQAPEATLPVTVDERLAACEAVEDLEPARALALAESVLAESAPLTPLQRVSALSCRGFAHATLGRRDEAHRDAWAVRGLANDQLVGTHQVRMLRRSGVILHRTDDRVGSVEIYAQALAAAERQNLEQDRIPILVNLGVHHSEYEEHERARVLYEQALALMHRTGDLRFEAPVRYNLALNLRGQGLNAEARPHLERALALVRESGFGGPAQAAMVQIALSGVMLKSGDPVAAREVLEELRASSLVSSEPSVRNPFLILQAEHQAAAGQWQEALETLDGIEPDKLPELQVTNALSVRSGALAQLGRHAEALALHREAAQRREAFLRNQNYERMAAVEAHLRDREQREQLQRLQDEAKAQAARLAQVSRQQLLGVIAVVLLMLAGLAVLLWQRRMNRRLDRVSRSDPLTGLSNRRDMSERLRARSGANHGPAAVLLIDIDFFKSLNDRHGHELGDHFLREFAQRLEGTVGTGASVARWGGEEFLVLLDKADEDRARAMAERLRAELARPLITDGGELCTTVSIGYANLPIAGKRSPTAWNQSLQLADSALYLAKGAGRDGWAGVWVEHVIKDWPPERLGREASLARSLGVLHYASSRPLRAAVMKLA